MTLYHKHRPTTLKQLFGQDDVVASIKTCFRKPTESPHCVMFTGPSGCGKTTTARILRKKLNCSDSCFHELNCADFRGIESIRRVRSEMHRAPIGGDCVVYLIDECHQLTKDAQNAMLKMLEDTPSHVWFFLATTDPQKLIKTVRTRATEFRFKEVPPTQMVKLLNSIAKKEGVALDEEVVERIAEHSEGSPRKALVLLDQVYHLKDSEQMLDVVSNSDNRSEAFELARLLMNSRTRWPAVAAALKTVQTEPEGIRRLVLAFCSTTMLGGKANAKRAYLVASVFVDHFYDSGKPGLVRACYEVMNDTGE